MQTPTGPAAAGARTDEIEAVRAFNRFYTARVGALRDGLLATAHPLPEARILFELGRGGVVDVADLRRTLDLDAGYLSRLLARLEKQALVRRERSPDDGRRQRIALTDGGRDAYATLDTRSTAEIGTLLEHLGREDRARLLEAMDTVRAILEDAPRPAPFVLRAPRPGDFGWVVERHGALYAEEHGWGAGFEALVAGVVANYASDHDPAREAAWIAEVAGRRVGSIFCVREDDRTAKLRLLLVEPRARGMGVGEALVDECIRFARAAGYAELRLWTNATLAPARRIYQRAGFALASEATTPQFGVDFSEQVWSLRL
jgi:DNA-binding MarR family transcriptional regulator/N-acetylglutamate synthase-like GNAT family acetyltransferase